jgi:hypothetical protein
MASRDKHIGPVGGPSTTGSEAPTFVAISETMIPTNEAVELRAAVISLRKALGRVERAIDAVGSHQMAALHITADAPASLERTARYLRLILGGYAEG